MAAGCKHSTTRCKMIQEAKKEKRLEHKKTQNNHRMRHKNDFMCKMSKNSVQSDTKNRNITAATRDRMIKKRHKLTSNAM